MAEAATHTDHVTADTIIRDGLRVKVNNIRAGHRRHWHSERLDTGQEGQQDDHFAKAC